MPTKQRVVLLVLVLFSVLQQGVRWTRSNQEPAMVATVQAAEAASVEQMDRHCSLVHVNSAGMAELQTLPGIGPIYAERIIIERREQLFVEKMDLLRISGIGEKRLAQIVHLICLFHEEHVEAK